MAREMKDSGIPWIGEIPKEWMSVKLGLFFTFSSGNTLTAQDFVDDGKYDVYGANGKRGKYNQYNVIGQHILIGRVGALCGNIHLTNDNIWVTEHSLISYSISDSIHIEFAAHLLSAMDLGQYASGTAQPVIAAERIRRLQIPIPSKNEQLRIAYFLDAQCARIDAVIEKTRASIEEYKKLKQAVITQAVTKGIRPGREMKDSGVEWVRKIPKEWESINPKALFSQRKDKALPGERQLTASQQYGVVYQDEYMELTGSKVVTVEKDFDILKHVEAGDFVISMRSFQGGLEYSTNTGSISSAYVMLIPNLEYVFPRYYRWLLKSSIYINALQSTTNMVRDGQAMRFANFIKVRLFSVPLSEQEEIADYLDAKCAELDKLINQKVLFLNELEKYKKSLIFEYVTGKKEVL